MIITYQWPKGPWQWVDSHDDVRICPFFDYDDGSVRYPSEVEIEGGASLRTVKEDEQELPKWIIDIEPNDTSDAVYRGLQAFPLIVDSLIELMKASEHLLEGDAEIRVAYLKCVAVLVDAGLEVTTGEQMELSL